MKIFKKYISKDNSPTIYNEKFKETYHSTSGAVTEAFEKFVKPALSFLKNKKEIVVLDFCFGLGYNSAALLESFKGRIKIIGLENDEKIFEKIQTLNPELKYYDCIKALNKNFFVNFFFFEIKIVIGDAVSTIKQLDKKFDIVFFDPFSLKKCPELWTEQVFKNVHKVMKKGAVLTTYSCARLVRENMKKAGFKILDGPIIGRRGPGTIGLKK